MRETKVLSKQGAAVATLRIEDAGKWDRALVTYEATEGAGTLLVLAPGTREASNLTGAPAAPAAGVAVHVGVGPGCEVGVPLPESLVVSLTATRASLRVELSRDVIDEDPEQARGLVEQRKMGEQLLERLGDVVIELRELRKVRR